MNKHLIVLGIAVLLICVGLSGCTEFPLDSFNSEVDPVIQRAEPYVNKIETNDIDLRAYANSILSNCLSNDRECQVNSIYRHIVENYNYLSDPTGVELIQSPGETMKIGGGDCEDLSIFLNSLLENIGIKTYLVLTEDHAYSLAYDINTTNLWIYVEQSLIAQVEEDWGDNIRQIYEETFVLNGYTSWYYGGNGSLDEYFDYLDISYTIESTQSLHLYVVPSSEDFNLLGEGKTFYQYLDWEKENVLSATDTIPNLDRYGGIILSNENWQDATVSVSIEFYFHPSFYELFKDEKIVTYNIDGVNCVVLDPTAGTYGFPGYDGGAIGEKTAIDPITLEYHFLE